MSKKDNKIAWYSISNAKQHTYEEFLIWQVLRKICRVVQINVFSQEIFCKEDVEKYFIVDFLILPVGIVVELDGQQHLDNIEYDSKRDCFLESLGLTILRFDNKLVRENLREVIITILKAVSKNIDKKLPKDFYDWINKNKKNNYRVLSNINKKKLKNLKIQELNRNKLYQEVGKYSKKKLSEMASDILKQMFFNIK